MPRHVADSVLPDFPFPQLQPKRHLRCLSQGSKLPKGLWDYRMYFPSPQSSETIVQDLVHYRDYSHHNHLYYPMKTRQAPNTPSAGKQTPVSYQSFLQYPVLPGYQASRPKIYCRKKNSRSEEHTSELQSREN